MKQCLNYQKLKNGTIKCLTCNHFCKLKNNQLGICGVKQNLKNHLYSLVYGYTTGLAIDPIEKKPLYHFFPRSKTLSFGTLGCNFCCSNCQNFFYSQIFEKKGDLKKYQNIQWGQKISPEKIVKNAIKFNCKSIAYTYNEPTVFLEYALDTMKLAHNKGLKNIWVTNGYMSSKTLNLILPYLDAANIDIKSFSDNFYQKYCGAKLQPVLDNCQKMFQKNVWIEITTLVIPSLSDNLNMLKNIAFFIKNNLADFVPWHISAFTPEISWKLKNLPQTKNSFIEKICKAGKTIGLKYIYAGNVSSKIYSNTICPKCKKVLIKRQGFYSQNLLTKDKCSCGNKIEGIFI